MKLVFNLEDTFATFTGVETDIGEQVSQLIIPDFYMGLPVEVVYVDKTKWCDTFVEIVIGNNVKAIQNTPANIFGGTTLKRIYLGKSLRNALALTSSGVQIGENITDIYYHPDCPIAIPTQNGAGNPIVHHKGNLDIKYQLIGDQINKTPLIPFGVATEEYVNEKTMLTKTELSTINLFDNVFDEEGYINNGVDTAHASFHRTSYREIKRVTDVLHIRLVEAVPSFVVVLYTTDKKYINSYSCNKLASKDITLSTDNIAFFRIYSNKNTSSSARALITTEEIPDELTSEELLELINGKYVTTYLNEDFKNLVDEVQNLKDNTVSASSDKANRISTVKNYAENQESIRAFEKSYYVGADKTYTTIDAALKQWKADGYSKATVYISNGEYIADADNYCGKGYENVDGYRAVIFVDTSTRATASRDEEGNIVTDENGKAVYTYTNIPKTISFIGESREGVVIRTKIGNYVNAPILIRHGNVEIKNMTVIADHSDTPDFSYPTKSDGSRRTQAYALHIDGGDNSAFGESGAKVLVENVTAISYQSPAFGMGTIPNSTIRLVNCKAISYTESEENIYNAGYANSRGAILCHKSVAVQGTATKPDTYVDRLPEKLELINVEVYSKNYDKPLYLSGSVNEDYNLLAINTVLASGVTEGGEGYLNDESGNIVLDENSSGNTCENLNKEV